LSDLLKIKNGKDHKHLDDGVIPVYGSGGIMRYANKSIYDEESILLPRKGTLDNIQYVNKPFWTVDTIYYTEIKKELVDAYFLYNYLKLLDLSNLNSGTGVPSMTFGAYYGIKVNLPKLTIQKQVAKVLSDLDAKIEVNNKINAELEALAKTIYDYWFVQFDFPTSAGYAASRGKPEMAGKPYKSSGGKMVYNEELKREMPEGWEVKQLKEIESNIITGKTPSTKVKENFGGEIPFITIDDIRQSRFIYKAERTLTKQGAESQSNKYLEQNDICVSCIGTVGVIGFVGKRSQSNQQINTISKPKDYNRYYLFQYLNDYFNYNMAAKKGAVLSNMNKGEFEAIPVIEPIKILRQKYFESVDNVFNKISNNIKENQILAELRDWLLPMLMNGQVRVGSPTDTELILAAEPQAKYK
jgi:type I restriction enzyme S subunit